MMNGWAGGWAGVFWMALFWIAVAGVIYFAVRSRGASDAKADREPDAMGILEERFARGEIHEDEYTDRRRVLEETRR